MRSSSSATSNGPLKVVRVEKKQKLDIVLADNRREQRRRRHADLARTPQRRHARVCEHLVEQLRRAFVRRCCGDPTVKVADQVDGRRVCRPPLCERIRALAHQRVESNRVMDASCRVAIEIPPEYRATCRSRYT
jgi:hypothetical protein